MRKIPTIFFRDENNMKLVGDQLNPTCQWVFDGEGIATRKYDGTCVMLDDDGKWWARREVAELTKAVDNLTKEIHTAVVQHSSANQDKHHD